LAESLAKAAARLAGTPVAAQFAADPRRFGRFSREACGLLLDFSRQRLDAPALEALVEFAATRHPGAGFTVGAGETQKTLSMETILSGAAGIAYMPASEPRLAKVGSRLRSLET